MPKLLLGGLAALALVGVGAGATLALDDDEPAAATAASEPRTLALDATAVGFVPVNHDGEEPLPGDSFVERFTLADDDGEVGALADECVLTPAEAETLCTFVFTLEDGTITATGLVTYGPDGQGGFMPEPFEVVVTGGTGAHAGADGTASATFADHSRARWTFELA